MSKTSHSLFLILMIFTFFMLVPLTYANVPPPIEYVQTEAGGLYTTATNVSMPYAEVNATIHLSGAWYYNISVSCSFYVLSLVSQNLTTAFVYPSVWSGWIENPSFMMSDFSIRVNNSLANHTILSYDEFKVEYDSNQTNWEKVEDCDFALFNFTIEYAEPIYIDVNAEFSTYSPSYNFIFDYIVDTARGWELDTREIVNFKFSRDLDTDIIEFRQYPNESLTFSGTNYNANLTWDFHISSFPSSRVTFIVQQQEYPEYLPIPPPIPFPWIPILVLTTAVVITVVGLRKIGRI
ncbi:MAG: hypothetical protein ACW98U_04250 [Candidatus Thorarchaeota archaeon]